LGGGVTTQTAAGTKTAGDNPDGLRLNPQLRKAAGPSVICHFETAQRDWEAKKDDAFLTVLARFGKQA